MLTDRQIVESNAVFFERRFLEGYGIRYPEPQVIRFHRFVLEYELGRKTGRVLDFGCGLGTHARYFQDFGYIAHGCDTRVTAVSMSRMLNPVAAERIFLSDLTPDLAKMHERYDVIVVNQVLGYFPDTQLKRVVDQFYEILAPGGVLFATMFPRSNGVFENVTDTIRETSEVTLTGRLAGVEYINFKEEADLENVFGPFDTLHTGLISMRFGDYGGNDQLIYVGQKK